MTETPHCILVGDATGDNRLVVAVASRLVARASVVLIAGTDQVEADDVVAAVTKSVDDDARRREIRERALSRQPIVTALALGPTPDLEVLLRKAGAVSTPSCVLALAQNVEQNLRVAVVARRVASDVPLVMRSFDPDFADQIERTGARGAYRAYSVAHLSAPSFVAAALLNDVTAHQLTMRVGAEYVSVYRLELPNGAQAAQLRLRRKRGLLGRSPREIAGDDNCQVLARCKDGRWERVADADRPLEPGEQILIGGPMTDVLNLALGRRGGHAGHVAAWPARRAAALSATVARHLRRLPTREELARALPRARERLAATSRTTRVTAALALTMTVATVWLSLGSGLGKLLYEWVVTALGNTGSTTEDGSRVVVAAVGLATGGIMLALLTSMMSAWLVRERIVEDVRRRAKRMRRHVVIVGLDDVGVQVSTLLHKVDVRSTVVVPGANGNAEPVAPDRRIEKLAKHTPVLTGELLEILDQAQIDRARAVVACSEDNLVNVQACMRAKRSDSDGGIPMIARIFNDEDAKDAAEAFKIDHHIAAVDEAAPAFVDAALEHGARRLRPEHAELKLRTAVWHGERCVKRAQMAEWHEKGIRVLAVLRGRHLQPLPVQVQALRCNDLAVLAGPEEALREAIQLAR